MSVPIPIERIHQTPLRHELASLRSSWLYFLVVGILLVVLGTIAVGYSIVVTIAAIVFYGALMGLGGAVQIVSAFWARHWSGVFVGLLSGVIYLVIGLFFIRDPADAAITLTLLIAALLMVGGLFRVISAVTYRFHHWGYAVFGGLINIALGAMIYVQWPVSGLWIIGLFLGIEMIVSGWTWIMLALSLKSHTSRVGTSV